MTADGRIPGAGREHAVRIPNGALAFRPRPEVLAAIGEVEPLLSSGDGVNDGTVRAVWEYDGSQFTPIAVRPGVADEGWSEPERVNPSRRRTGEGRRIAASASAAASGGRV